MATGHFRIFRHKHNVYNSVQKDRQNREVYEEYGEILRLSSRTHHVSNLRKLPIDARRDAFIVKQDGPDATHQHKCVKSVATSIAV